ncbi:MAG: hypothetical protein NW223_09000 [Hyphomicrobiaceae bacterium]|nr:hypothetical protein [Hyphomicrobiaceae bacterium]
MKAILTATLASALLVAFAGTSLAAQKKRGPKQTYDASSAYAARYPNATPRQRANSEAFERGGYYESISEQHAFGSRSWWYLKERELGGAGRN